MYSVVYKWRLWALGGRPRPLGRRPHGGPRPPVWEFIDLDQICCIGLNSDHFMPHRASRTSRFRHCAYTFHWYSIGVFLSRFVTQFTCDKQDYLLYVAYGWPAECPRCTNVKPRWIWAREQGPTSSGPWAGRRTPLLDFSHSSHFEVLQLKPLLSEI